MSHKPRSLLFIAWDWLEWRIAHPDWFIEMDGSGDCILSACSPWRPCDKLP